MICALCNVIVLVIFVILEIGIRLYKREISLIIIGISFFTVIFSSAKGDVIKIRAGALRLVGILAVYVYIPYNALTARVAPAWS